VQPKILTAGIAALAWLGVPATAAAQEEGDVGKPRALLERSWPEIREARASLPPFLCDTVLTLRSRTGFIQAQTPTGLERQEVASGGWIAYRSGWLLDGLQIGATLYGAAPVYAPAGKDGLLLTPGENAYYVFGEAFGALRYEEYAELKGYRQMVVEPYINRADNKMTPNTFEGVTVRGTLSAVEYFAGYLTRIKTRLADEFVPMSVAAGAPGSNYGVALLSVMLKPLPGLSVKVSEQYGVNTFNTLFAHVEHRWPLADDLRLQIGAQFTDQRAVGRALVATTQVNRWITRNGSARIALTYRDLTLKVGGSMTGAGNKIQSPWGFYPGYLLLIQQFFNNANEKAVLAGVAYDFNAIVPGLSAYTNHAWGTGSSNAAKGSRLGAEWEHDLTVEYRAPRIEGLLFRIRGAVYDQAGNDRLGYLIRSSINWELPLL
jgi:outer membrane porin, OprD family